MSSRVRWVFLMTAVLAGGLAGPLPLAGASPSTGGRIDLSLYYDEPLIPAGGQGSQTLTAVNTGDDANTPAVLTLTTPVFLSLDPGRRLPTGCDFLYRDGNPDGTVPEVIRCSVPPLGHDQQHGYTFHFVADNAAAPGSTYGEATLLPAAGSPDVEQKMADNLGWPSVVVAGSPTSVGAPATGHVTDVYLTTDLPAIALGSGKPEMLTVGNRGPQATTAPIRLVVATPPLTRFDQDQPMPPGCGFLYDSADPAAPELIHCTLPGPMSPLADAVVALPLVPVFGAPVQTSWGVADAFPDRDAGSTDIDPVPANNFVESGVQVIG
jgi:hypothetical protein